MVQPKFQVKAAAPDRQSLNAKTKLPKSHDTYVEQIGCSTIQPIHNATVRRVPRGFGTTFVSTR